MSCFIYLNFFINSPITTYTLTFGPTIRTSKKPFTYERYEKSFSSWASPTFIRFTLLIDNDTQGTKEEWNRCNHTLSYTKDVLDSVVYNKYLSQKTLRALVYR